MEEDGAKETVAVETETMLVTTSDYGVLVGADGQQYVTVEQDGATFAIPAEEYASMQQGQHEATVVTVHAHVDAVCAMETSPTSIQEPEVQAPVFVNEMRSVNLTPDIARRLVPVPPPAGAAFVTSSPAAGTPSVPRTAAPVEAVISQQIMNTAFKPIRVDNWGIFLLNRLQSFFQNKEHCDLTLRFPSRNAQIKVHRLVLNACTDYFMQLEHEIGGTLDASEGGGSYIDMPSDFTPEAIAPIIRYMYTGKLDLRTGGNAMFAKIHYTATKLGMSVLTKLMDAQLSSASTSSQSEVERKLASKKRASMADSAVRQMRKIKRIEKRFSAEEKRLRMIQSVKQKQNLPADHVPGKKLPIWKKRSSLAETSPAPVVANGSQQQRQIVLTPVAQPPPGAVLVPLSGMPTGLRPTPAPQQPKAYGRLLAQGDKPKLPRQIREIQENLTFEKIRRTGTRNVTAVAAASEEPKEMSVEELREFMAEQRKRLQEMGEDDDADDYFDNDAGLDYDDDHDDYDEEESPQVQLPLASTKPILKAPEHTPEGGVSHTPRKSVRFSLRPGSIGTPSQIENPPVESAAKETTSVPGMDSGDLDSTVDEFNKAVEEDEEMEQRSQVSRSGRPIVRRLPHEVKPDVKRRAEKSSPAASPPSKRAKTNKPASCDNSIDLPPPPQETVSASLSSDLPLLPSTTNESEPPAVVDHSEMVAEVLRTYPNLFKDNKTVKLKVTTKDAQGKAVTQEIVLRQQERTENADAFAVGGLKNVAKVKYTGGRGRPKKIKPGEVDPHENERKAIAERLQQQSRIATETESVNQPDEDMPTYVSVADSTAPTSLSSATTEADFAAAESLMHIQSAGDQSQLNGSADYLEKAAVVVHYGEAGDVSTVAVDDAATHSLHVLHPAATEESANACLPEMSQDQVRDSQENSSFRGVSKLAADWDEDEEADGRDAG